MNNNKPKNNSFKNFIKSKILTKTFGYSALAVLGTVALTGALVHKYSGRAKYKPSFYNYQSYIDDDSKRVINENFTFKEFEEIQHFTKSILTNKAAGGIGNDAQAVQLIRDGKLRKIDYAKMFNDPKYKDREKVLELLSDTVKEHIKSYDKFLTKDQCIESDGTVAKEDKHLIDYFAPYFSQDMVVAYNPQKVLKLNYNDAYYHAKITAHEQAIQEHLLKVSENKGEFRLIDIMKALTLKGYNYWEATYAMRDNMIYGSAYVKDPVKGYIDDHATGKGSTPDKPNWYKEHIDHFVELFQHGTNYSIRDTEHVVFNGDGQWLLNNLINPTTKTNAGLIYNGDALDAYFSEDNFENKVQQGTLRFFRPKINLLLVDGLVISENTSDHFADLIYESAHKSFLSGVERNDWNNGPKWVKKIDPKNGEDISEFENIEEYKSLLTFDHVGYTPAWKNLYNYVKDNYFDKVKEEKQKNYIASLYEIGKEQKIYGSDDTTIKATYEVKHFPIEPESKKTQAEIKVYYDTKLKS
ncbi:spermidine/putrescine ABC transporter substrate-binding protein [Mycoplasmopsis caviae]|uniref:Hypothetical lipoprotein (MG045 family) n=1 Tax=Mycoplasmopsis caviae TaxID=55603 RepID=A0A3P8K8Q4_9BACT|nr:spermidine/putrescine ABC transporter substrate-binding protein [Mycoplasmopsis caviae]UUD35461.1 spermidine/putrescine ABC transporter substrate-binding protein [Mycoplasmopsis caviae]VDR41759.1 Hypothetical lipoprotein (MG045 family) [Mycoplasmopsis caviae]